MNARCILRDAAAHIRRHGRLQGSRGAKGGPCCAIGAIEAVSPGYVSSSDARRLLCGHLGFRVMGYEVNGVRIADWNDARRRTAEQVIAALEEAGGAP